MGEDLQVVCLFKPPYFHSTSVQPSRALECSYILGHSTSMLWMIEATVLLLMAVGGICDDWRVGSLELLTSDVYAA